MKYLLLVTGVIMIAIFSGCGNNSTGEVIYTPKSNDSTAVASLPTDTSGVPLNNTTLAPTAPNVGLPVLSTQQPVQATAVTTGLNPEHGKPGHRCDIAVGAPLASAAQPAPAITPAKTNTTEISSKNAPIITTPQPVPAVPAKTAAGMNPEHGKPGHRCDIAVGAPLDSKPAEIKTETQTTTVKPDGTPPVTPLLPGTTTPVAEGMNPEHGKPGHRCDIAVGAPLPKQ